MEHSRSQHHSTPSSSYAVKSIDDTLSSLQTNLSIGLSSQDVLRRRQAHGMNDLEVKEEEPLYLKFFEQFKNPLIYLLLGSAFISLLTGELDNAVSITLVRLSCL